MRVGVGVDTEHIARFQSLDRGRDRRFFKRVYTAQELRYCFSKRDPAPHLAVRYCGKEAVVKAIAGLGIQNVPYRGIAITRTSSGMPHVRVHGYERAAQVCISLSHSRTQAIAFAIAYAHRSATDPHRAPRELHRAANRR